ncbi:MAG: hypothetical protein ACE5GU_15645, partial [Candidatus Scalinduaceae bacterium]
MHIKRVSASCTTLSKLLQRHPCRCLTPFWICANAHKYCKTLICQYLKWELRFGIFNFLLVSPSKEEIWKDLSRKLN